MSVTERLANMSIPTVIITVIVLLAARFALLKLKHPAAKSIAEIAESLAVAMALVFLLIRPFVVQAFFIPSASMHPTLLEHDHLLVNRFIYRVVREPELGDVVVFKAPLEATPGETVPKDFIKRTIGVPGDIVRITPGYVMIGDMKYDHVDLRGLLSEYSKSDTERPSVLLKGNDVYVDGRRLTRAEIGAAANDPGAKIKVVPGKVYINGKAINEPYIAEDPDLPYPILAGDKATPQKWIVNYKGKPAVKIPKGRLLVMGDNRNDSNDARFWGLLDRKRVLGKAMVIFWPLNRIRIIH
ncbi:MAG: signal peptidase I [Armatimonadota bacterium]|nr:signal peptidase I [bacterium]